jgi:hypothetical protein
MTIEVVEIVKVFDKRVWVEKDFMGTVHIKMQHEGMPEPFDFIQIQYDYAYTSNGHQANLTKEIMKLLGIDWNETDTQRRADQS